jgi:hypothetical protein
MTITYDCRDKIITDWKDGQHWNGGKQATCIHCGRPALLLDDARRPAHKVCGQSALAALLGLQPDKEPRTREAPPLPPPVTPDHQPYSPCKLCSYPLWAPNSQQHGVCAGCWLQPEEAAVQARAAAYNAWLAACAEAGPTTKAAP